MVAFQVSVNGKQICVATVGEVGVLGAHLIWRHINYSIEGFELDVGGIILDAKKTRRHVDWKTPSIGPGDEITIRVIDASKPDPLPRITPGRG